MKSKIFLFFVVLIFEIHTVQSKTFSYTYTMDNTYIGIQKFGELYDARTGELNGLLVGGSPTLSSRGYIEFNMTNFNQVSTYATNKNAKLSLTTNNSDVSLIKINKLKRVSIASFDGGIDSLKSIWAALVGTNIKTLEMWPGENYVIEDAALTDYFFNNIGRKVALGLVNSNETEKEAWFNEDASITLSYDIELPNVPTLSIPGYSVTTTGCTLNWTESSGRAQKYYIYKNGAYLDATISKSYNVSGLTPGSNYIFTVSAYNEAGETSQSSGITVSTKLSPPNLSMLYNTSTSVMLSWNASSGIVSGYKIYNNGSLIATTNSSTTTALISLAANTQYKFTVSSYNSSGESAPSSILSLSTTPPSAPTVTVTNITANSYTVSWKPSGGMIRGYIVIKNGTFLGTTTNNSSSFSNLQPATNTTYTISAYNDWGTSAGSSVVALTKPLAPTSLSLSKNSCIFNVLTWNASSGTVTGYNIYQNGVKVSTVATTGGVIGNLTPNTQYSYTVTSYNSSGESNQSSILNATTLNTPADPANCHVGRPYSGSPYLFSWTESDPNVQGYVAQQLLPVATSPVTTTNTYSFVGEFTPYTFYKFSVYAYTGVMGEGCSSGIVYVEFFTDASGQPIQRSGAPANRNSSETNLSEDQSITSDMISHSAAVNLFPNPVVNKLFVSGTTVPFDVVLMNLQGQVQYEGKNITGEIDMSEFRSGIYLLKIRHKEKETIYRIVKQ
ncbi:MAG TPA: fibronectin type III domain-containing protein [Paludibacter sp.]|nr:fibronectin type III domain-containing protein [Paludibacter sp.]